MFYHSVSTRNTKPQSTHLLLHTCTNFLYYKTIHLCCLRYHPLSFQLIFTNFLKCVTKMSMEPEVSIDSTGDEVNELIETSEARTQTSKKKPRNPPKRVHKSEREKMKREHLNDLFLALANALGQSTLNNGKASILSETNKLLKELEGQIDSLRKENATLLSESQYVLIEKNELKDDTFMLESEVERLRNELHERTIHSEPNMITPPLEQAPSPFLFKSSYLQTPYANPFYVLPVGSDLPSFTQQEATQLPAPTVSKPHARYPTPSDSWPSQILTRQHDSS